MTAALYRRLAPDLTVDNDTGNIEQRFASAPVLAASQGISLEDAQRFVDERAEPTVPGAEQVAAVNRGGPLYRIRVSLAGDKDARRTMEALVQVQGSAAPPFEVRWRRYGLLYEPPQADAETGTDGR
jgi:general secretion pathway protein K